jgi:hypothetical protein
MISNQQLRDAFLSPQMRHYFGKKLAPLPSKEIDKRIEEALKFLNMAVHSNGDIPFSSEIDEVWHYWILETAEYANLCCKLNGGSFLHHSSNDYAEYVDANAKARRIDLERGVSILASYVQNYGPFEASRVRYWPLAEHLMKRLGWDLDQLNAWLGTTASREERQAAR